MIRRYFYIFSASLFILFTPTTGVKANIEDHKLEALERLTNSPPDGFNYQAVLRDANNDPLASTEVTMQFTLSNTTGDVWIETHTVTTNAFGLVTLVIGQGTKTGGSVALFVDIDWADDVSVKVEADSGSGLVDLGTTELQSVPYANYASNGITDTQATKLDAADLDAEQNIQADWSVTDNTSDAFVQNKPAIPTDINDLADIGGLLSAATGFSGDYADLTNVPSDIATTADLVFSNTSNVISAGDANDDFVFGSAQLANVAGTDDDNRMFFDKSSGAFRAGSATGVQWDIPGNFSFVAGQNNTASGDRSTVGGGQGNNASANLSTIGGGINNTASADFSTVGGGQDNNAFSDRSTVGGGYSNTASGIRSTIGGGQSNIASSTYATVGGGRDNDASANFSTIGGGISNSASTDFSTIGGGYTNTASGDYSTVGGGQGNTASGDRSTVGGGRKSKRSSLW